MTRREFIAAAVASTVPLSHRSGARLGYVVVPADLIVSDLFDFFGLLRNTGFSVRGSHGFAADHPLAHDLALLLEHEAFDRVPLMGKVPTYSISFKVDDWSFAGAERMQERFLSGEQSENEPKGIMNA